MTNTQYKIAHRITLAACLVFFALAYGILGSGDSVVTPFKWWGAVVFLFLGLVAAAFGMKLAIGKKADERARSAID